MWRTSEGDPFLRCRGRDRGQQGSAGVQTVLHGTVRYCAGLTSHSILHGRWFLAEKLGRVMGITKVPLSLCLSVSPSHHRGHETLPPARMRYLKQILYYTTVLLYYCTSNPAQSYRDGNVPVRTLLPVPAIPSYISYIPRVPSLISKCPPIPPPIPNPHLD